MKEKDELHIGTAIGSSSEKLVYGMLVKMCELFGLSANKRVNILFSWKGFSQRGKKQPHGWGVAFYPDKSAIIFKEPIGTLSSPLANFLRDYQQIESKIFISHLRYASVGEHKHQNTHPFSRKLGEREWIFAHNGTILDIDQKFTLEHFKPLGKTDSEYAFCLILERIQNLTGEKRIRNAIEKIANEIAREGGFNFLLSNGKKLFAYYSGFNSLYYLQRIPPYHTKRILLKDEDISISLGEMKEQTEKAILVATQPLTDETWIDFEPNKLYEFSEGTMINKK
ncbi:MAG: class II glutamine amidotransferase [Candidatus Heimdallarchaeota archaeon]|nr:MAG: class II glutamine amidotransferase [Candidatus Gerdarchaeota archaeon]